MTIRTPLDKQHFRTHLTYSGWKYMTMLIAAFVGWSLIYMVTAYQSPQDKRIDVYIKSNTVDVEMANALLKPIWDEVTPDMEVVETVSMLEGSDYNAQMQLQVFMVTGEGDIYFLPLADFKSYAATESFVALDDLIESGVINVDGIDMTAGRVKTVTEYLTDGTPIYSGEEATYGVPMDSLYAFMEGMQLDNRGMIMCIAVNNQNDENVIPFFNALIQAGRGEKPDWLQE